MYVSFVVASYSYNDTQLHGNRGPSQNSVVVLMYVHACMFFHSEQLAVADCQSHQINKMLKHGNLIEQSSYLNVTWHEKIRLSYVRIKFDHNFGFQN